jgi:thiamine-phosphate pyrophosphorylase
MKKKAALRVIDANLNRLREALRVSEEVARFVADDKWCTGRLKRMRHEIAAALQGSKAITYSSLLRSRDSIKDVGKRSIAREMRRVGPVAILKANLQRAKEALRVVEEFSKLIDEKTASRFKRIRFKLYNLEKVLIERVESSVNTG